MGSIGDKIFYALGGDTKLVESSCTCTDSSKVSVPVLDEEYKIDKKDYKVLSNEEVRKNSIKVLEEEKKMNDKLIKEIQEKILIHFINQFNKRDYFQDRYEFTIDSSYYSFYNKDNNITKKSLKYAVINFNNIINEHGYKVVNVDTVNTDRMYIEKQEINEPRGYKCIIC